MRDSKRIDEFCKQLERTWHNHPDWRFGQLISNIFCLSGNSSFFYQEDDKALEFLRAQEKPMPQAEANLFFAGGKRMATYLEWVETIPKDAREPYCPWDGKYCEDAYSGYCAACLTNTEDYSSSIPVPKKDF